jgi:hypothetical protein
VGGWQARLNRAARGALWLSSRTAHYLVLNNPPLAKELEAAIEAGLKGL